jgi:hypothetical protein
MAHRHVNITVNRRDHVGWLVSNAINESNPNMLKELIAFGEAITTGSSRFVAKTTGQRIYCITADD